MRITVLITAMLSVALAPCASAQVYWQRAGLADSNVTSLNINSTGKMVAIVNFARLYVSSDSGANWSGIPSPSNLFISLAVLDDEGTIYTGDQDARGHGLQRTTDAGVHWKTLGDSTFLGCNSIGVGPFGDLFTTFSDPSAGKRLYH